MVDALKPAAGHDVILWDDELAEFGVRCRRSGGKVYFLKYRTGAAGSAGLLSGSTAP
jgi:hypothetical protein